MQPLEKGIIRKFKHKYRKLLLRYVVSKIDKGNRIYKRTDSQIIKDVNLLKVIL